MIRTLILIQLLVGFVMAMIGAILMIHLDILTGVLIMIVGMYAVIRATTRKEIT